MSAIGFLCLILFFIGLCLAVYYAYICYDVPSSRTHTILQSEDDPCLKYPNDFNGNESVAIPLERLDEPDVVGESENLLDSEDRSGGSARSAIETGGNRVEVEHVQLERGMSEENRVLIEMDQVGRVPTSDEEDGLVLRQDQTVSASSILSAGRLNGSLTSDKHVHFPYIDTAEDDVAEGTSCDQPAQTICNMKFIPHSRADQLSEIRVREPVCRTISKQGVHNPIDDIKVHVVMPSSNQSSCEELRAHTSDSDTSEPEITEYSFTPGQTVESVSEVLADELGTSLEPKITKIAAINNSVNNLGDKESQRRQSISSDSSTSDSTEETTRLPSPKDHFPINTPPSTPPETDSRNVINNQSAKILKQSKDQSYIVLKTHRSNSVSSVSSLSAEESDVTNARVTAKLLQK